MGVGTARLSTLKKLRPVGSTSGRPRVGAPDGPGATNRPERVVRNSVFLVGPQVEETGQVAHISRLFLAGANFTQPLVTVILRKAYGLGAMAMAGGGFDAPAFCCAWPTGEIGAMGLEGAVRLGYRDHLAAFPGDDMRESEFRRLLNEMTERGKALNAASVLEFDAVIDPAETRIHLERALSSAGPSAPHGN